MGTDEKHVYLASSGYEADLFAEIQYRKSISFVKKDESLFWSSGSSESLWWPQWQLWNVKKEKIDSISHAIRVLKANGKNWLNLDYKWHRRSSLIQDGLPKVKIPDVVRGQTVPAVKCGAWFLEEPGLLCFSTDISLPFKNGIIPIKEDKQAPSRAFHKLDEVFARLGRFPGKNEKVMDLGSFPGGWTWVLSQLSGHVISVDTVALEGAVAKLTNVEGLKKDAFKLKPIDVGAIDWFFSDIICEPSKLYKLVIDWKDSGLVKNFICTIKFKGNVDFELLSAFQAIPNSEIFHLNANKHELTWVCLSSD